MHYERAPCFRRLKPDEDITAVAHAVVEGIARKNGQISQEKAFYLEGKTP
jgi:hypothetical protein